MAGWGSTKPTGRALGIAAHRTFLTYVAVVADVSVDDGGRESCGLGHRPGAECTPSRPDGICEAVLLVVGRSSDHDGRIGPLLGDKLNIRPFCL